jgi:hypothetical protein
MPDYSFPQMDLSAGPDWQMAYKVAVIIATHRGYPLEAIISQTDERFAECFPQSWSNPGDQTVVRMSTGNYRIIKAKML